MNKPNAPATSHIGNQLLRIRRQSTDSFLKAVQDLDPVSHEQVMSTIVSLYPAFAPAQSSAADNSNN